MENRDCIEFYSGPRALVARVHSSMVPALKAKINIRGQTWTVRSITYALDHGDSPGERCMRANVDLTLDV